KILSERVDGGLIWPRHTCRWHRTGAKLPHHLFPDGRSGADILQIHLVQQQPGCLQSFVVAGDAVAIENGRVGGGGGGWSGIRGLLVSRPNGDHSNERNSDPS